MRKKPAPSAILLIAFAIGLLPACTPKVKYAEKFEAKTIGIPVKSVNWVRTHFGVNAADETRILVTMGQQADNFFVLDIDSQTGALRQFIGTIKESNYPTATLMSRSGVLYIGAAYAGRLYRYDPAKQVLEDLGAVNPENATFPCAIDEDKSGRIWIGSYGTADLTSFDPETGEFERYGRMDDIEVRCPGSQNGKERNRRSGGRQGTGHVRDSQGRQGLGSHRLQPGQFPHPGFQGHTRKRRP
jgi:hypothetical protein